MRRRPAVGRPVKLADATSPDTAGAGLVLVPVGSIEQHGPHLPLDTDTTIAVAVADRVASELSGSWVAPAVSYGSSGEHQSFSGTASVGTEALTHQLVELVRSLRTWASRVVIVNAHGGNVTARSPGDRHGAQFLVSLPLLTARRPADRSPR